MSRHSLDDTIVAIATPPGEGALGIIRLSGPEGIAIADRLFRGASSTPLAERPTHTVHYGHIVDGETVVDEVLVTLLRAPRTYTREDLVEITGHGGMTALRRLLELALAAGARLAEPGEFTKRAFVNGRIDLAQGEAVLDVIRARTDASLRAALQQLGGALSQQVRALHEELANLSAHIEATLDFSEDDIALLEAAQCRERLERATAALERLDASARGGRLLRDGASVVICGRPNVGKSSLLNALLRANRAIVTPIPGTTRDTIEETANLGGVPVRLTDTAGITITNDPVEQEGVERSRAAVRQADWLVIVLDRSQPLTEDDRVLLRELSALREDAVQHSLIVLNKSDVTSRMSAEALRVLWPTPTIEVSALRGDGLELLERAVTEALWGGAVELSDGARITNVRHQEAIRRALAACGSARTALVARQPLDCIAVDVREAVRQLGDILGLNADEDVLDRIFAQFCIGK